MPETADATARIRGDAGSRRRSRPTCACADSSRPHVPIESAGDADRTTRTPRSRPAAIREGVADVLADLTRDAGWDSQLAREDVVRTWAEVAGEDTARHTTPVAFTEGTLTVQADSTAWAKQLQLMRVSDPLGDRPEVPGRGGRRHPLHRA